MTQVVSCKLNLIVTCKCRNFDLRFAASGQQSAEQPNVSFCFTDIAYQLSPSIDRPFSVG